MSNSNNIQQTDREKALAWWGTVPNPDYLAEAYFTCWAVNLGDDDILEIWRKETQPTTTDNGGELKCTEGEWYKSRNIILVKGKQKRVGLMYTQDSHDRDFRAKFDEEMEANLDLCVAAKDLYKELERIVDFIEEYGIRDSNGKSMLEDIGLDSAIEVLQKANKNYKP